MGLKSIISGFLASTTAVVGLSGKAEASPDVDDLDRGSEFSQEFEESARAEMLADNPGAAAFLDAVVKSGEDPKKIEELVRKMGGTESPLYKERQEQLRDALTPPDPQFLDDIHNARDEESLRALMEKYSQKSEPRVEKPNRFDHAPSIEEIGDSLPPDPTEADVKRSLQEAHEKAIEERGVTHKDLDLVNEFIGEQPEEIRGPLREAIVGSMNNGEILDREDLESIAEDLPTILADVERMNSNFDPAPNPQAQTRKAEEYYRELHEQAAGDAVEHEPQDRAPPPDIQKLSPGDLSGSPDDPHPFVEQMQSEPAAPEDHSRAARGGFAGLLAAGVAKFRREPETPEIPAELVPEVQETVSLTGDSRDKDEIQRTEPTTLEAEQNFIDSLIAKTGGAMSLEALRDVGSDLTPEQYKKADIDIKREVMGKYVNVTQGYVDESEKLSGMVEGGISASAVVAAAVIHGRAGAEMLDETGLGDMVDRFNDYAYQPEPEPNAQEKMEGLMEKGLATEIASSIIGGREESVDKTSPSPGGQSRDDEIIIT